MKNHNWKKKTVIAGIAAMLIASGNLPINLVAEDNENPAPDTTETITEENTAPEISDSEDNTNTETTVSTEETDSSPDQSSADKSEAQKTNASADTSSEEDQAAKAPANDSLLIASLSAAAAPGIQIQYDESTTIHTVKEGNDTLILYCMNNALHWPHIIPSISSVPTYSETTLEGFCADNDVTYSDTLESELKALLYAGYPYNGFGQYQIVKQKTDELTDDEYNELLTPPQYLRDDFPDSLGTTIFTLDNSASGSDNYYKLVEFFQGAYIKYYLNGTTTPSGLTYSQLQNTAFYKAASCLINYGDKAKEYYNSIYVSGYYVTDEQAYASTRDAVWNLLYNSGVPNNTSVNTEGLTGRLASAASGYTILNSEPTSDNVSISGDLSFYYNETDGKWHTNPITLSVPESYNANFTLVLPDGVQEENNQTQFNRTGSFSLVSDDPAAFTQVQLTADMPWMVGDLKVYEPATIMKASDGKGFQNMVGAVIRTAKISKAIQITKRTSVTVKKVWDDNSNQDGKRTSSVQAQLYANNTPYGDAVTLNAGNSWTYTWEKLPVSESGQNVTYTVQEVSTPDEYSSVVTGDASSGFTITNMYTPGKTAVQVTKVWDDHENQDGKRPTNVSVQLYADGVKSGDPVTLTASNKWLYTWTGLA
ncbi:MAG: Cna B-type domain-containing protein, partial [Lachnospiraceae bacterium]|nr:Cna B-type domain-containing protein [Lachnospiraceae bacterium]